MRKQTQMVRIEPLTNKDRALIEKASNISKLPKASFFKAAILSYSKSVLNSKKTDLD